MSTVRNIVFDLDGTLIDSAAGIRASLKHAFWTQGMTIFATDEFIIGQRLHGIIRSLAPSLTADQIEAITEEYRQHYDEEGWKSAFPYAGAIEMLCSHYDRGATLFICTNKPTRPTFKILQEHGMLNFFRRIVCSDTLVECPYEVTKTIMLRELLREYFPNPNAVYVGDTAEDAAAAHEVGIPFVWASYGYGKSAANPSDLMDV